MSTASSGTTGTTVGGLANALRDDAGVAARLRGRRPAVFLDYDGVLTPIVERPEDAVASASMRATVHALAARCPVCVVSGRDRQVVQRLMGLDDLVVAGSHGFDIWSPTQGTIAHDSATGFEDLIAEVTDRLRTEAGAVPGAVVEPKHASVAVHYRQVEPGQRHLVTELVDALLAERPDELKVTPGKMVYELQPKIDWNKGRAVVHLLDTLGLNTPDVLPLYLGDDITDEDAFRALHGRGIGILVGRADDPELAGRVTAADFGLADPDEVERFLGMLSR